MTSKNSEFALQTSTNLSNENSNIHLRVAFDVGSSTTKAKAAIFDGNMKIEDLGGRYELMPFQKYLDYNGNYLSSDMQTEGLAKILSIICHFRSEYPEFVDIKVSGIATAWARRASNSDEFLNLLKKYAVNVETVSQDFEGIIGYKAAMSLMDENDKNEDVVICDIGGGSFQIAFNESSDVKVYHGKFGSANFFDSVKSTLGHQSEQDQNRYLNQKEVELAKDLAATNIERSLKSYIATYFKDKEISVSGIGQFLNKGIDQLVDGKCVDIKKVQELIYQFCDLTAEEVLAMYPTMKEEYVYMTQTNLIFLESLMKGLDIKELSLLNAKSTDYVLNNTDVWEDCPFMPMELVAEGVCMDLIDMIA